jgi:Mce-associated membrane protein
MIAGGGIVAVTLITLGGLAGWFGHRISQENHAEDRREFLIGVARQAAVNLTTIDYSNVDADIKRILDSSTGTFHDDFDHRSAPFIQAVTQAQSKSQGTVTEAGLESQDGDEAQVLLAVSVRTSVHGNSEQQPRAWRMRITVASNGDRDAKVSNVQFVP